MDFEDPEGAAAASPSVFTPFASSPGEQAVGGLFFDDGAVRTRVMACRRDHRRATQRRRNRQRDHPVIVHIAQARSSAATTTTLMGLRRRRRGEGRDLPVDNLLHRRSRPTRGPWRVPRRWLVPFLRPSR